MIIEVIILVIILLLCSYVFFSVLSAYDISNLYQRRTFGLMMFWIILWVITILLTDLFYRNYLVALWVSRLSLTTSVLIAYWYYLFVSAYSKNKKIKFIDMLLAIITAIVFVLTLTNKVVTNVDIVNDALVSESGSLQPFYVVYTGLAFVYSAIIFWKKYLKEDNSVVKTQMMYILVGSVISISFSFFTTLILPLMGFKEIRVLGPIGLTFFIFATYYAIVRYRFLSTRLILSRFLYTLLLAIVPYGVFHIVTFLQNLIWGGVYDRGALISGYFYSVVFIYIFIFANKNIDEWVQKIFSNSEVDPEKEKNLLARFFDENLDIGSIVKKVKSLLERVYSAKVCILITEEGEFLEQQSQIPENCEVHEYIDLLTRVDKPIIKDELVYVNGKGERIENLFTELEIQCLIPLRIKEGLNWKIYIALGDKGDEGNYSIEDIDYIKSISSMMSVALQRAYLHKKVRDFNEELQQKVKKATQELRQKKEEVEETLRKERDMMDILGHELRTPLAIARNGISIAEMNVGKNTEEAQEKIIKWLKKSKEAILNEINIVDSVLSSTKITEDRMQLNLSKVEVNSIINTALEAFESKAEGKGLDLKYKEVEDVYIYGDKTRFKQIVTNLTSNAVKYTQEGFVEVKVEEEDKNVCIVVKDTGVGISEEDMKNLGKKFYRAKQYLNDTGETKLVRPGGTGLGLYVSFGLAELMNGKLEVESEVGKGSVFTVCLPKYTGQKVVGDSGSGSKDRFAKFKEGREAKKGKPSGKSLQELMGED